MSDQVISQVIVTATCRKLMTSDLCCGWHEFAEAGCKAKPMHFNALEWIAAIGGVAATIGAWRTEIAARWQARVETLQNDNARRENELHRARHAQLYQWWHDMPDGPARLLAMRWFGEWTGARDPYRGSEQGAIPPGFGCADANQAYDRYVQYLEMIFHPGLLGPTPPPIEAPDAGEEPLELPADGWYIGSTAILQPGYPVPDGANLTSDPAAALSRTWQAGAVHVYQSDSDSRTIMLDIRVTGAIASRALDLTEVE